MRGVSPRTLGMGIPTPDHIIGDHIPHLVEIFRFIPNDSVVVVRHPDVSATIQNSIETVGNPTEALKLMKDFLKTWPKDGEDYKAEIPELQKQADAAKAAAKSAAKVAAVKAAIKAAINRKMFRRKKRRR